MGKVVASTLKEQIKEAGSPLQTCASHAAGAEAAIHSMREIFEKEEFDGVLLIDASSALNNMNCAAALHNIQIQCQQRSKLRDLSFSVPSSKAKMKKIVTAKAVALFLYSTPGAPPLSGPPRWTALLDGSARPPC